MSNEKKIELKSEDINDILSRPPKWIIRWGNILMIIIVISLFGLSAIFKLPESVLAPVSIKQGILTTGTLILPESKIEKVKIGQQVRINIKNYPHSEFGFVNAIVSGILPESGNAGLNNFYTVTLQLPYGLVTVKGLNFNANEVIEGEAEIITGERTILEKVSGPLKKFLNEI